MVLIEMDRLALCEDEEEFQRILEVGNVISLGQLIVDHPNRYIVRTINRKPRSESIMRSNYVAIMFPDGSHDISCYWGDEVSPKDEDHAKYKDQLEGVAVWG